MASLTSLTSLLPFHSGVGCLFGEGMEFCFVPE